jgi:predicted transposase YdaD
MIKTQWNFKDAMKWNFNDGWEKGIEKGCEVRSVEVARNALMRGFSIDQIHDIIGLDTDAIRNIRL